MPSAFDTFYKPHLDRVSRSFALCIRELHEPLRSHTALSYLLCRVLDTVEDAQWQDHNAQSAAFAQFDAFLKKPAPAHAIKAWVTTFPQTIEPGEAQLLADAAGLFAAVHALPTDVAQVIIRVGLQMSRGMHRYAQAWAQTGSLRLFNGEDVNRYCYFVAGVVGELLTELFVLTHADFRATDTLYTDAHHFGLFLQKVNLLKDQRKDEAEQRFLCPARSQLVQSLTAHAQGTLRYITALPITAVDYRIFCAWSAFLGVASLPHIEAGFANQSEKKISREETFALMQEVAHMAADNAALTQAFASAMQLMPQGGPADKAHVLGPADAALASARRDWFASLTFERLSPSALGQLGMAPMPS